MEIKFEKKEKRRSMFWGIAFIVLGFVMLLNYVLGINLPAFRILFSIGIIYVGISLLFGGFNLKLNRVSTANEAIFSESKFSLDFSETNKESGSGERDQKFQTVFGNGELDLTEVDFSKGPVNVRLDTVFGETRLIVKKGTNVKLTTDTVFGSTNLPKGNKSILGKFTYDLGADENSPQVNVKANVVFGALEVIER